MCSVDKTGALESIPPARARLETLVLVPSNGFGSNRRRRQRCGVALIIGLLLSLSLNLFASEPTGIQEEYESKAAWLYKLLENIDWPARGAVSQTNSYVIGVLGQSQFGPALAVLGEQTVRGRKIIIRQIQSSDECRDCQLVFICASERDRLPQLLETFKRAPILTVGEVGGFVEKGGLVNLVARGNRIRIEVNHSAARRAGLSISSQLLKEARLVES
jgi:hypothetical protein